MSDESQRPIVIKRVKKGGHGHHGGVWKLAYADFMTAMMAFFLLMWLLGSTAKSDLQDISGFFEGAPFVLSLDSSGASDSDLDAGGLDTRSVRGITNHIQPAQEGHGRDGRNNLKITAIEAMKLEALEDRIRTDISGTDSLKPYRDQLLIDVTAEGLRIQIVDDQNRPMFASGSANILPHARTIMRKIGEALNDVDNLISISGHTDAVPYSGSERGYSNWELSADRANAARRELIIGGMEKDRVLRVVGLGSAVPFDAKNPLAPINRRISIVVLNRITEDAIIRSGEKLILEESHNEKTEDN